MVKQMNKKQISAIAASVALVAGAGLSAVAYELNDESDQLQAALDDVERQREVLMTEAEALRAELVERPVVVETPDPIEVEVDNGNLDMVLEHMLDENVSLVVEGLDEDNMSIIVERIDFLGQVEQLGEDEIKSGVLDLIDLEKVNGTRIFASDVTVLAYEPSNLTSVDFGNESATVEQKVYFRQGDELYSALVEARFEGLEFEELELIALVRE